MSRDHCCSILAPGGSISNMYAIIIARHKHFPGHKQRGMLGLQQTPVLYTSRHVSIEQPRTDSSSAANQSIGSTTGCTITEKAPTRAFSWLKAPTSAFTFKTLLRHYAKRALTPWSLNVKLGP